MKKGGIITNLFSLLLFVYGAFLIVSGYVELPMFLDGIKEFSIANLALDLGRHRLLIPGVFLVFEALSILLCRKRKPYTLIVLFYLFFVYFTLVAFTHLRMKLATPAFLMSRIDPSRIPLLGVLIFLEAILAFVLLYVSSALNSRRNAKIRSSANDGSADDEIPVKTEGRYMSRKKMKALEAKEKRKEEKAALKEKRKEEKRQQKLDAKAEAEAEKAERIAKAEAEREEKKLKKKEEKLLRKEAKKKAKEEADVTEDVEESFSSEDLNAQISIPKRAISLDEPLSFPEFSDIGKLFVSGLKLVVGGILLFIPLFVLVFILTMIFSKNTALSMLVTGILELVYTFLSLLMMANFSIDEKILSMVDFKRAFLLLKENQNIGSFILYLVAVYVICIVVTVICAVTLVGLVLLPFVSYIFMVMIDNLLGQFTKEAPKLAEVKSAASV